MRRASCGEIRWKSIPDRGRCKGPVADLIVAFQGAERKGFGLYCPWDCIPLEGLRSRAGGRDGGRRGMAVGLELRESLWFGEVGERRPASFQHCLLGARSAVTTKSIRVSDSDVCRLLVKVWPHLPTARCLLDQAQSELH